MATAKVKLKVPVMKVGITCKQVSMYVLFNASRLFYVVLIFADIFEAK